MKFIKRLLASLCPCILAAVFFSVSINTHAEGFDYKTNSSYWGGSDEDTILVESEADTKISYTQAVKAACKNFLGLDIDSYFSGGKNKSSEVIRQLNDLAERSHYRLRLDKEEVTLNFTLNL